MLKGVFTSFEYNNVEFAQAQIVCNTTFTVNFKRE